MGKNLNNFRPLTCDPTGYVELVFGGKGKGKALGFLAVGILPVVAVYMYRESTQEGRPEATDLRTHHRGGSTRTKRRRCPLGGGPQRSGRFVLVQYLGPKKLDRPQPPPGRAGGEWPIERNVLPRRGAPSAQQNCVSAPRVPMDTLAWKTVCPAGAGKSGEGGRGGGKDFSSRPHDLPDLPRWAQTCCRQVGDHTQLPAVGKPVANRIPSSGKGVCGESCV